MDQRSGAVASVGHRRLSNTRGARFTLHPKDDIGELDDVIIEERRFTEDSATIDERAIGTVEIADCQPAIFCVNLGVNSRYRTVRIMKPVS